MPSYGYPHILLGYAELGNQNIQKAYRLSSRLHLFLLPYGVITFLTQGLCLNWLLNGDGIRFKGAFFRWLIFDRLNRMIFATGGFALFVVGLFTSHLKKNTSLFFVWTLSVLLYMTIFAKGNVNHDYYQLPIVAPGVVLVVIGAQSLLNLAKTKIQYFTNWLLVSGLLILSLAFGWFEVRGFFNINNPAIVEAGKKVDEIVPKDALVIAPYQGDPAFLYQTNRHGWPIGENIDMRIASGAQYYVTTSRNDEYNRLKKVYPIIFENALLISNFRSKYESIDAHPLPTLSFSFWRSDSYLQSAQAFV
jgi:hypothetical protein